MRMGGEKAVPLLCRFGERMHVAGVITEAPVVARGIHRGSERSRFPGEGYPQLSSGEKGQAEVDAGRACPGSLSELSMRKFLVTKENPRI